MNPKASSIILPLMLIVSVNALIFANNILTSSSIIKNSEPGTSDPW